jgi:ubiquinone/menaquinone biosynthesis C-methylase UbiE
MDPAVDAIYSKRFDDADARAKDAVWREVTAYLQRFVPPDSTVIDIACDRGDFVRHITAAEKWATDLRDVSGYLTPDVRFVACNALDLSSHVEVEHFDVAFMSNYLEHLAGPDEVIRQLQEVYRVLRPGGRVIILQPNIRLVGGHYWDFIDHRVALTERSLDEAVALAGLRTVHLVTRFLPFTTKSRLPQHRLLVRGYLRFPPAWTLLGKQTLLVAQRP